MTLSLSLGPREQESLVLDLRAHKPPLPFALDDRNPRPSTLNRKRPLS